MNRRVTDLDKKLQEMALMDWNHFVDLVGEDAINAAKVCLLRKDEKSYGEICNRLGLTKKQARYACGKC